MKLMLENLKQCALSAKEFTAGLFTKFAETTVEVLEGMEKKIDKKLDADAVISGGRFKEDNNGK